MCPVYVYECDDCKHSFEETRKIAEYKVPTESPCPQCGEMKIFINNAVTCGFQFRGEVRRKPPGVFNDRLKEIKKSHPGNKINVIE